jgi:pantoate--beta-alanine ligase
VVDHTQYSWQHPLEHLKSRPVSAGNWTEADEPPPPPKLAVRMRTVRTVVDLREALAPARREGRTIGLVPTMGALHDGHLSLVHHAREQCDVVVVSLFVNPAQFNERGDLERYPRDERRDAEVAAEASADVLFAPSVEEVYPPGFATTVEVLGVSERLEGAARGAAHFRGVSTVVTKLLCMALPDVAYFGQKDAQQVVVIRHLARDLNLPVRIEALATVRERDGLAMSSRNALLSSDERSRALALPAALDVACALAATGERSARCLLDAARAALRPFDVEPEYLELVEPDTLEPIDTLTRHALLAIAARIGEVRLIDNAILSPIANAAPTAVQEPKGEAVATCNA